MALFAACDPPAPASPDAAIGQDAPDIDAVSVADAFVSTRDWPAGDVPASAEVESGIVRELVTIPGADAPPNPTTGTDTPGELDRARFLRFRATPPVAPRAVLVAMPGLFGGAGSYEHLARALVRRSLEAGSPGPVEVWVIDRRSNLLEDLRGLDAAEARGEPEIARGYYFGSDTVGGERFAGFVAQSDVAFMSEWGLATHFGDVRAMIERIPEPMRRGHVFFMGHSLGASMAETFAAWRFADGGRGVDWLAGVILLDGSQGETPIGEREYLEGGGGGFMPFDGVPEIRTGNRYIQLPLLGVSVYAQAEIVALAAVNAPEEVRMNDRQRDRVLATLFGTSLANIPPMTNAAALGLAFDDASNGLSFAAVSAGAPIGPTEPYESLFGITLRRPSDRSVTYRWTDALDTMPPEHTPLQNLAESWFSGRTNFAEWYFPARLTVDLAACAGLQGQPWHEAWGLRCDGGATMDAPVLAIAAGLRSVASYAASRRRGAPIGPGRRAAGASRDDEAGYRILDVTFMTHIDPLTAADTEANPVPEAILAFVAEHADEGRIETVSLP